MGEARSFYLGPGSQRLIASTWDDIVAAAAAGILDETHWVELKQDIPAGSKQANRELAKDLASLSVDGGVLVVGIEDAAGGAGAVVGTELAGLVDRISQVAAGAIRPPLTVTSRIFEQPGQPGRGVLVVTVPASQGAPHMVDNNYWGRGHQRKRPLSDDEVRRLMTVRFASAQGFEARLRALSDDLDRMPHAERHHGHLYLLAEPAAGAVSHSLVVDAIGRRSLAQLAQEGMSFSPQWSPSWTSLHWTSPHPDGVVGSTLRLSDPLPEEHHVLQVLLRDDGAVHLACGAGTMPYGGDPEQEEVIVPGMVLELTHATIEVAAHLATTHRGYDGPWRVGLFMDLLQDRRSSLALKPSAFGRMAPRFQAREYLRVVDTATSEMETSPQQVVESLVGGLLRGLGDDHRLLPYKQAGEIFERIRRL